MTPALSRYTARTAGPSSGAATAACGPCRSKAPASTLEKRAWTRTACLPLKLTPARKRHLQGHHGDRRHIHLERKTRHVQHRLGHVADVDHRLRSDGAIRLQRAA